MSFIILALGGAIGSLFRFILSELFDSKKFPYGTLLSNFLACGLIILISKLNIKYEPLNFVLHTGFIASLSTFSSLAFQITEMIRKKSFLKALLYLSASSSAIAIIAILFC